MPFSATPSGRIVTVAVFVKNFFAWARLRTGRKRRAEIAALDALRVLV